MRITEAARRLQTTARMLRYREALGLLAPQSTLAGQPGGQLCGRAGGGRAGRPGGHRRYDERDLRAAALAAVVEQRYAVGPAALAFALRAVSEPEVGARVRALAELTGRLTPPMRALAFEQQKAQRLLHRP
jgi:hypothetical protein